MHIHRCIGGCGNYYVCGADPDRCSDWECPACSDRARDEYFQQVEMELLTEQQRLILQGTMGLSPKVQ